MAMGTWSAQLSAPPRSTAHTECLGVPDAEKCPARPELLRNRTATSSVRGSFNALEFLKVNVNGFSDFHYKNKF